MSAPLQSFTGFSGFATVVRLNADTQVVVVAQDEPTLKRAVNLILAGQGEYAPQRTKPCLIINPDALPTT